jgi:histone H1/5
MITIVTTSAFRLFQMIKEAILAQAVDDGKSGSSPYAIAKYIGESHRDVLPTNYRKVLSVQLRSFAAKGRLVKVKASFKLAPAEEKKAAAAAKNKKPAAAKRKRTARAAATKKPEEAKKARAKRARKAAPAPKPKQHKSVRRAAVGRKANMASA